MTNSDYRLIFTNNEGGVSIVIPTDNCGLTLDQIKAKDCPSGKTVYTVNKSAIPIDRSFRSAWKLNENTIKTDMAKAREIHKNNIRTAREPLLTALDIEFQKALETSASTTDIVSKKQALRDAPADSAITSADTEAKLKAQWNKDILGDSPYV